VPIYMWCRCHFHFYNECFFAELLPFFVAKVALGCVGFLSLVLLKGEGCCYLFCFA
jgi:hypothetical protein